MRHVVGAVLVVAFVAALAYVSVAQPRPGETMCAFTEFPPLNENAREGGWDGPRQAVLGGRVTDGLWCFRSYVPNNGTATFDIGGEWDLFEAWVSTSASKPQVVTVYLDGQRWGQVSLDPSQALSFLSVPVTGSGSLGLKVSDGYGSRVLWKNPRLVRGRTRPSQPTDVTVLDGDLLLVEHPGEYRVHIKQRQ